MVQSVLMTMTMMEDDADDGIPDGGIRHRVTVADAAGGCRLDKALSGAIAGMSRSRFQALLEQGHVRTDDRIITEPSHRVKPGQTFDVFIPDPEPAIPQPQDIPIDVVFEDDDLLVIDKPAGLVVHPAAGNPDMTLVNALLAHCGDNLSGIGGVRRPGIVHRLDKDTSGLMVVAKTDRAHAGLSAQFGDRSLSRTYQAVVWGVPRPASGEIDGNIGRCPTDRKRMAVVAGGGKTALTRYRVLKAYGTAAALVECKLMTGRTHQIRVHLAALGHPVIGDQTYGRGRTTARLRPLSEPLRDTLVGFPRQALHAVAIEFNHPGTGEPMRFSTGLPPDILEIVTDLERSAYHT